MSKPHGRTVTLAFDQGIIGLVGKLTEPVNLVGAHTRPSFKYILAVKEERFYSFLSVMIIHRHQLLVVLLVQ